jgi:hypothetical protein
VYGGQKFPFKIYCRNFVTPGNLVVPTGIEPVFPT